jgi:hypothetical protein
MGPRTIAVLVGTALAFALTATAHPTAAASQVDPSDFNGDGYADLAIGAPNDRAGGSVNVLYGASGGLTVRGNQLLTRDTPGVEGARGYGFGDALAAADFDRDGYADLAISAPFEGASTPDGGVNVLYGSPRGLTGDRDDLWTTGDLHLASPFFGGPLTAGDFDADGFADLVIVAFYERPSSAGSGMVVVLRGSAAGLTLAGARKVSGATPGIGQGLGGHAVAAGDIDGDRYDDLAVGNTYGGHAGSGAVRILYGSRTGLTSFGSEVWSQDSAGVKDVSEIISDEKSTHRERFGAALAIGDFDEDGHGDLAVGVPNEITPGGGAVNVLYGTSSGLTAVGDQFWHQDAPGIAGVSRSFDGFGFALAAGDLDGDGADDLAIGVPRESHTFAGAVHTLYGGPQGLTARRSQLWTQNTPGVPGVGEQYDAFGATLAVGDFGRTPQEDLVVGIPEENIGAVVDAGGALALYGRATGLSSIGAQPWDRDTVGVYGVARPGSRFGSALAPHGAGPYYWR